MDRFHNSLLPQQMSEILAIVCKHKSISITELTEALREKGYRITRESELSRVLRRYPEVEVKRDDYGEMVCEYSFNVEVCMNPKCKAVKKCNKLHICTFFVNGRCDKGNSCKYPHDLSSPRNTAFLHQHHLDKVEPQDIYSLIHFKEGNLAICTFYNSERGCKRSNDCNFLHICRQYIVRKCPRTCEFNHDIFKTNCKRVLKAHNISVAQPVTEILHQVKNALETSDQMETKPQFAPVPLSPSEEPNVPALMLKEEICTYSIRGKCYYNEKCRKEHHVLPYKWFYKIDAGWQPFSEDEQTHLEEAYCDVSKDSIYIKTDNRDSGGPSICHLFDEMKSLDSSVIRRISTPSSVTEPPNHPFTTEWIWYIEVNPIGSNTWKQYSKKNANGQDVSNKGSTELEDDYQLFLENPNFSTVTFSVGRHSYKLDFTLMKQENISTKTVRKVRRRPAKFITNQDISKYKLEIKLKRAKGTGSNAGMATGSSVLPDWWDTKVEKFDPEASFQLVDVNSTDVKYKEVQRMFNSTCPHKVKKIQRVQNEELWEDYARKRDRMNKRPGGSNERQLWHGTREYYTQAICQQNFDFRCSGSSSGTAYGQGSYFARDARYSSNYAKQANDGCRFMFLARVLVGEYTVGNTSHRRPPEKMTGAGKIQSLYDSCVNSITDPTIFVIFDKAQMYPEYLVQY